jgi:hypothetical protein
MDESYSPPAKQATPERLMDELKVMRDAVVRLQLSLEDYTFHVLSNKNPDSAAEVRDILAKIKSTKLNSQ